jgi:hypothetical protein
MGGWSGWEGGSSRGSLGEGRCGDEVGGWRVEEHARGANENKNEMEKINKETGVRETEEPLIIEAI